MNTKQQAFYAVATGDIPLLSKIVRTRREANWRLSNRGWSLLDQAVQSRQHAVAAWLLDRGADPNTIFLDDRGISGKHAVGEGWYFSPFASAVSEKDAEMTALFLKAGASRLLPKIITDEDSLTVGESIDDDPDFSRAVSALLEDSAINNSLSIGSAKMPTARPGHRL